MKAWANSTGAVLLLVSLLLGALVALGVPNTSVSSQDATPTPTPTPTPEPSPTPAAAPLAKPAAPAPPAPGWDEALKPGA